MRCNEHDAVKPVSGTADGEKQGRAAERAKWCSGSKKAAGIAARKATKTEADAAA